MRPNSIRRSSLFKLLYWLSSINTILGIGYDRITQLSEIQDWEPDDSESLTEFDSQSNYETHLQTLYEEYLNSRAEEHPNTLTRIRVDKIAGQFQDMAQLFASGYEPNSWLVKGLIPSESIITLQGQAKCGKSTFALHMVKELVTGGEFLNQRLEISKVVYVTEQNQKSFMAQLYGAAMNEATPNLSVLTVERTLGFTQGWKDLFRACEIEVSRTNAKLLIIDSWGRFTGITEDEENKAAPVQERITELRRLISNTGATVLILHHVRKSGGDMINAGMGTSALAQQADAILTMSGQPAQEDVPATRVSGPEYRVIQSKGRFPDMVNGEQVKWEKERHRYVLVSGAERFHALEEKLFTLLPTDPNGAVDYMELANLHGEVSPRTVEDLFPKLKKTPGVQQLEGTGVRGVPARLYRECVN